jgi:putative ABC transport system permease protein
VAISQTENEIKRGNAAQFGITTFFLTVLAIIVAIVGGIALAGALSIAVVERTKEIGVLRAIGARSRTILGIFVLEGLLQGIISWLIAIPVSILASPPVATAMGSVLFGTTMDYQYNWSAVFVWLVIVVVISILASILPTAATDGAERQPAHA